MRIPQIQVSFNHTFRINGLGNSYLFCAHFNHISLANYKMYGTWKSAEYAVQCFAGKNIKFCVNTSDGSAETLLKTCLLDGVRGTIRGTSKRDVARRHRQDNIRDYIARQTQRINEARQGLTLAEENIRREVRRPSTDPSFLGGTDQLIDHGLVPLLMEEDSEWRTSIQLHQKIRVSFLFYIFPNVILVAIHHSKRCS